MCLCSFVSLVDASLVSPWSISSQKWEIPNVSISCQWRLLLILGYLIFSCSVISFLMEKHRFLCLSFPKTPELRVSCCLALGVRSSGTYEIQGVGSGGAPMHLQNGRYFWPLGWGTACFCLCVCPEGGLAVTVPNAKGEGGGSRWKMQATCSLSSLLHSPHICKTTFVLNWIDF